MQVNLPQSTVVLSRIPIKKSLAAPTSSSMREHKRGCRSGGTDRKQRSVSTCSRFSDRSQPTHTARFKTLKIGRIENGA